MAKKMQRLDESPDFRPFKFRIQAFTNAFLEEVIHISPPPFGPSNLNCAIARSAGLPGGKDPHEEGRLIDRS